MSTADDLALLQRFEPVIHYTRGEQFFPLDVAHYVEACSLWVKRRGASEPVCLGCKGELKLDKLAVPRPDMFDSVFFMTFADPLTATELATYKLHALTHQAPADVFHAGRGRLARVGYVSRFSNALFLLSLLGRGRVPGDAAAASAITYKDLLTKGEAYHYCGRVMHENGWIVLQYWFLYAFNNWRSGFYGFNDHEADWEMICIYLSEGPDGQVTPEWVAYASHDFSGDDIRRRWDDPELEKVGEHPIIYAGAGSHASYYTAGEYLVELELPFLATLARLTGQAQKFWREKLRQFYDEQTDSNEQSDANIFHLPFVDYARGDGLSIGPGQSKTWSDPHIISKPPLWVSQYRGLWGLHIHEPFTSENAPAGPMYNRDGTVRRVWYDPVGWAGLDKLPPSNQALKYIRAQQATLSVRQAKLIEAVDDKSNRLTGLGVETAAVQNQPHLKKVYEARQKQIKTLSQEVDQLRAEFAQNGALLEAFNLYAQQFQQGERDPARAHIHRARIPIQETELRVERLMETWAAISTGLMLISLVTTILFAPQNWFMGLVAIVTLFFIIESAFRKRLIQLVTNVTIGLAVFTALVLLIDFFPQIALIGALVAGGYMMWENLRELWG